MDQICLNWLRSDSKTTFSTPTLSGTPVVIFNAAPQRWGLLIGTHPTDNITLWFGEPRPLVTGFSIPAASPFKLFHETDYAGVLSLPIWLASSGSSTQIPVLAFLYEPTAYATYKRIFHEYVSQFQSP